MKDMKLETMREAWAFYGAHKAYPITRAWINNGVLEMVSFDEDAARAWLDDFRECGETDRVPANRAEWLEAHADTPISGFGGSNAKKLWQVSQKIQNQVYGIAWRHPYCQSPASRAWAHPS